MGRDFHLRLGDIIKVVTRGGSYNSPALTVIGCCERPGHPDSQLLCVYEIEVLPVSELVQETGTPKQNRCTNCDNFADGNYVKKDPRGGMSGARMCRECAHLKGYEYKRKDLS